MPPTLVHGVDISALEGWMIKINNNPSMFGSSLARRWFHVGFVSAGDDQKLVISYSSNKSAKEPRGWLYIEDVSGAYCRRDMIEVVSPARTLRFKGETAAEHRLWSDSLHKLCNPPKPASQEEEKRVETESSRVPERDRDRMADPKKSRDYAEEVKASTSPRVGDKEEEDEEKQSNGEEEDLEEEEETPPIRRKSLESSHFREETRRTELTRRHSGDSEAASTRRVDDNRRIQTVRASKHTAEEEESDDESDCEEESTAREAKQPPRGTDQRRPSLVDSIKSSNPCAEPKVSKPMKTPTRLEHEEPQYESSRFVSIAAVPTKREYEEEKVEEDGRRESEPVSDVNQVPADNNFVEDDWDAHDNVPTKLQTFRNSPVKV